MDTQSKLSINHILDTAAEQKASDVHLSVGSPPILRIDDKLITLNDEPIINKDFMESFVEDTLDPDQKKILQEKKEIVLSHQFNKEARFRVNIFYQKGMLAAYLRYIGNRIVPLEKLGLPPTALQLCNAKQGLLIISGPFGSGKTTTTAAFIDYINRMDSKYVLTLEKPIEYIFANRKSVIEQREIGRDALSFEIALDTITQEDVDVLFLSELSSPEAIKEILKIANSERLVITNIEADTIIKTLEFFINSLPSDEQPQLRNQLAVCLTGIICQKLVPRVGGGQIAVAEIMTNSPAVQSHIKEGSLYQISNIIQTSRDEGMISLDWSLAELAKTNQILMEDALKHATDPQQLRYMLRA